MAEIILNNIHKYYGTNHVLRGVSLEVYEGSVVGLVGKNGAGKTTLFRIISGEESYEKGEFILAKGRRVGVLDQIPEYSPGTTVYQVLDSAFSEIYKLRDRLKSITKQMALDHSPELVKSFGLIQQEYENRGGYNIEITINRVCNGIGIDKDMQERMFSELSGGEKTRVNLARIILSDADILLLDEPTNHLDINAVEWLEDYLNTFKGTVVVISHDRYFLDRVSEKIVEIEDGTAISYDGNYSIYAMLKEQRRIEQLKHYEQELKKIKQLENAVNRMHDWANRSDNPKLHKRAFGMEKRLEKMKENATPKPKTERKLSKSFKSGLFSGTEVLSLKGIQKSFDDRILFEDINLLLLKGDRLVLLGNNGTGKTTLLKMILGETVPDKGSVKTGPSVRIAYLPQIITFEKPELTILETVRRELIIDEGTARNILAGFLFTGEDVFKTVENLSGGERSRLKLCLLMQKGVNLLILDEPTNHLDIASREWMEEVLEGFEGTILFVSHDRYFIRKFAQKVCELEDGRLYFFDGDYEEYRAWKRYDAQRKKESEQVAKSEKTKKDTRIKKLSPRTIEKKMLALEKEIDVTEQRISEIENEMEIHATDYERLEELLHEKHTLEEKHEELITEWMEYQ
ncbi:MAG: ABC-F type ribosomal protection protein [Clostridiaceae bacterium]|jgi:ATP-binding cassette subfamily F protein 3|nr:ABC-F type ribosomal protection protein [Clostridiaceae bacterium]